MLDYAETVYHRERFMRYTNEKPQEINMRCLFAKFSATLVDIRSDHYLATALYDKEDYAMGQSLGITVKKHSANGIIYRSVRREGESFALFKPNLIHSCIQAAHYGYIWNGNHISKVYKKVTVAN
ncbi:MAG: RES family NAD+ phosphorylase [Gammaproteobacteria bacterium]|nr:RES family NAD+ phosphorylase [Gammaproteobacteria bacterium]